MTILVSFAFFIIIGVKAFFSGRLYCNIVCPVGTLLGYISKLSLLKISINGNNCISCKEPFLAIFVHFTFSEKNKETIF